MHRTTFQPCGHTVEHEDEAPPRDCPECHPPQTWEERLTALRKDLGWFAMECIKSDEPDCAQQFVAADIAVRDCINMINDTGLYESMFDPKEE